MRRSVLAFVATLVLMSSSVSIPTSAIGEVQVGLSCTDGITTTDTTLLVDLETLSELKSAIEAMTLYPAGLTCTLSEAPLVATFALIALAAGPNDFAVGGGQIFSCDTNVTYVPFGLSAHSDATNTPASASGNLTATNKFCAGGEPIAHSKSKITCLAVQTVGLTRHAFMYAVIQQATGAAAPFTHIRVHAVDNGNPIGGIAVDQLGFSFMGGDLDTPEPGCPEAVGVAVNPLGHGNIVIRNN